MSFKYPTKQLSFIKDESFFSLAREVVDVYDIKPISGSMFSNNVQVEQPKTLIQAKLKKKKNPKFSNNQIWAERRGRIEMIGHGHYQSSAKFFRKSLEQGTRRKLCKYKIE